jgi:Trk K+ transport system NAD-binding subunit
MCELGVNYRENGPIEPQLRGMQRLRARALVALRENAVALLFVALWLSINALVFARGRAPPELVELVLGLAKEESFWGRVYQPFTQVVVFGLVVSVVVTNVTRRHRPESTARLLASEARDHVVVVGHTHLGERVRDAALERGIDVVVVDDDGDRISTIIQAESPAILGDPRDAETLSRASVASARCVVIAWDGAEVAAIGARLVREANPECELVLRCPDEDVGEVLARTYRARIVSTSRLVARHVLEGATKRGTRRVVVFGDNDIAKKTARALRDHAIETTLAPLTEDPETLAAAGVGKAELVVIADDDLGKNLIRVDRIRDLAPQARIVCRAFHEQAGEILTRPPFRCEVLSSSKLALDALVGQGLFGRKRR